MDNVVAPPDAGARPVSWQSLRFTPLGLYDLRCRLASPVKATVFALFRNNFDAADLAWFTPGLASASCAAVGEDDFYPEFLELRSNSPTGSSGTETRNALRKRIRDLTFDSAAMWDRAFGGTTLVVHVDGTTRPGSPKRPEFVKADVYFPGHLLNLQEKDQYSLAIRDIVQRFIVDIGIPTIERYERRASALWPLSSVRKFLLPYPVQSIQPPPTHAHSSSFVYHGQPSVAVVINSDDEDAGSTIAMSQHNLMDSLNTLATLKGELETTKARLAQSEHALAEALSREQELRGHISSLTSGPTSARLSSASAALRSHPVTPDRLSTQTHQTLRSSSVRFSPHPGVSPAASPSRHAAGSGLSSGASSLDASSNIRVSNTPVKSRSGNSLSNFVHVRGLDDAYPLIDLTRRNVAPFLWADELRSLDLEDNDLKELMTAMDTYSARS